MELLLRETYGGIAPLQEEIEVFMEKFDLNKDGKVSWEEFVSALQSLKEEVKPKGQSAKEFTSFNQFKEKQRKHIRLQNEP